MKQASIKLFFSLLIITICCSMTALGQSGNGKLSGRIIDSATNAPVDYATISLYKAGATTPFNGASSDTKGVFTISNVPAGTYKVTVDFIGYRRQTIEKVTVTTDKNLGSIKLTPTQIALKGVSITASSPVVETRIDKMVYNAANDLTAQGGVAIDVLKKVPQISVDIDGNVELQGSSAIRFLINGKPSSIFGASLADALQSIPASQIKSIEVITSPGAKYDASGTGGIINIILKDNKLQGMNGSVNLSAGTRLQNGSVNLNVRKNNFGAGLFFSGNGQVNTRTYTSNNRRSVNGTQDTVTTFLQDGYGDLTRRGYETGFNFQWDITKHDNLSGAIGIDHFSNNNDGLTNQRQDRFSPGNTLFSSLLSLRNSESNSSSNATDWNLDYRRTFKKEGRELELLYNTSAGRHTSFARQQQDYLNGNYPGQGTISNNPGRERETQVSLDYVDPFGDNFILETGAKITIETLNNNIITDTLLNNGSYINNAFQTYAFNYSRKVYAAYLSGTFKLFNFLDGKAGLRYERTSTAIDFPNADIPGYNTWAPSFVLQHKFDKTQSVKLAYSYRIERPDYGDLNPFYNISDPHNISTGNPRLRPEIGNNFELGYNKSFRDGSNFTASAVYRRNTDDIQAFSIFYPIFNVGGTDYNNVTLSQRDNIGSQTTVGMNFFGSVPAGKFIFRSNIQLGERTTRTPGLPAASGFTYRANLNASYQFPGNLLAELFGNYNSKQRNLQGMRPAFGIYTLAVRKQFLDNKASIGLTASNPFAEYVSQTTTTSGANFTQANLRQIPYRSFGITLSYKFGKLAFKDEEQHHDQINPPDNGN